MKAPAPVSIRGTSGAAESPLAGRVLLADDVALNRLLYTRMLEHLGCQVTAVEHGAQAHDAVARERFDVILMDCQMPVQDGFEATRAIRRHEAAAGARRTAIIALTASDDDDDRRRCLDAGMDDFLSKPFTRQEIAATLGRWIVVPPREDAGAVVTPEAIEPTASVIDAATIDRIRGLQRPGRPDIVARVVRLYLEDTPATLSALRSALASGDAEGARRAAHKMKSGSANVGAQRVSQLCAVIEAGDAGALPELESAWSLAEHELRTRYVNG